MPPQRRLIRIPTLTVLALLALTALAVADGTSTASAVVRATKTCAAPKYPSGGYFTGKIRVTGVSCSYGKTFVLAYYKCRTRGGKKLSGRCTQKVKNFRCTERRNAIPTEIDATVTCRRGSTQRIVHSYQQNLDG